MRVAIIHDYLTQFGGAERVLQALMELYPHAPVYTLVHDPERVPAMFDTRRLRTSFLQKLPGMRRSHRYVPLLLMPLAVEQFDLSEYDVVISATHSFGKGVITGPNTLHVSYCFTPTRYAWDDSHRTINLYGNPIVRAFAPLALSYIRLWDYYASARVDTYITLSDYVARRIKKYYGRGVHVIAPPVDVKRFAFQKEHQGYYLIVSRLVAYKRVDLAIEACEKLGRRLKVVGVGPEMEQLKKKAGPNTEFLGFVSDEDLPELYQGARALLFPQEEDFGITPLEAASCGKATIAFGAGGVLETVVNDITGVFFARQSVLDLVEAIKYFEKRVFDPISIRAHAEGFRREFFLEQIRNFVADAYQLHQKKVVI